jgi:hypothetical protein
MNVDWNAIWELVLGIMAVISATLAYWVKKLRTDVEDAKADGLKASTNFKAFISATTDMFAFIKKMNADKNFTQEAYDVLMDKLTDVMAKSEVVNADVQELIKDSKDIGDDITHIVDIIKSLQSASSSGTPSEIMSKLSAVKVESIEGATATIPN